MKYINHVYELYLKPITDLFKGCANNEYYEGGRGIKPDTACCINTDKKFSGAI
jgi:hypothetical protein